MRDYDSTDLAGAAHLAAEDAEPAYDRPTRAEAQRDDDEGWKPIPNFEDV